MRISFLLILILLIIFTNCQQKDFSSITEILKNNFDIFEGRISWMVQQKNGAILIKEHLSDTSHTPYTDDSSIHIASGCKWPAMTVIMKLVEDGKLSLTDTISKFYTNNEFSKDAQGITLLQLMTHTSGYGYVDDWIAALNISLQDSVLGIAKGGLIDGKQIPKDNLVNNPGSKVLYGDIGMQIAGAIAEKVTGKGFNQLFLEYLGNPLGMVNARFCAFDGDEGINIAMADGMYIRMIDYANFMLMLMNEGSLNGKQILKPETVKTILKDYTGNLPVDPSNTTNGNPPIDGKLSFGIGHWIMNDGQYHSSNGIHLFYNYFDTQNDYLTIFYLRSENDSDESSDEIFDKLTDKIENIILYSILIGFRFFLLVLLVFCIN